MNVVLCGKLCEKKAWPWVGACIRPDGHKGKCRGIENGMTTDEALRLSGVSVPTEGADRG